MSDYFTHLAARALGVAETAKPRRSIFEPRRDAAEPAALEIDGPRAEPKAPPEARGREPTSAASAAENGTTPPPREEAPRTVASRGSSRAAEPGPVSTQLPRATQRASPPPHEDSPRPPEPAPTAPTARRADAAMPRRSRAWEPELPALPVAVRPPRLFVPRKEARAPTVRVTIGRVDVRAQTPEQPQPTKRQESKRQPRMSLDEFLGRRR